MDEQIADIVRLASKNLPGLISVYRFGSWGTPHARTDSDVDLAVLLQDAMDSVHLWDIAQDIARVIGKDVDLVDLLQASTVMRMQVISTGKRLYCSNPIICERFEDYVYVAYARLNEERRGILEDIKQRGTVYG
ncbi:MAG: nucleotidyltransferase domain-containing protein [Gammaproteobacteria bacterium]|nr:nucleotidyltransferase domain-containing protein [Gammaproteobacteria bacterium]MCF6337236.1 nucleotidyltransferase domain-containing protein [Gammaproteobacteria bacterium]